jgi:hypothetical protein
MPRIPVQSDRAKAGRHRKPAKPTCGQSQSASTAVESVETEDKSGYTRNPVDQARTLQQHLPVKPLAGQAAGQHATGSHVGPQKPA